MREEVVRHLSQHTQAVEQDLREGEGGYDGPTLLYAVRVYDGLWK